MTHLTHLVHPTHAEEGVVFGTSGGTHSGVGPCLSRGCIGRTGIRLKECSYLRVIKSSWEHEGECRSPLYCQQSVCRTQLSADVWSANGRSGREVMQHSKGRENQPCSILKDELPAPPPARLHHCPIAAAAANKRVLHLPFRIQFETLMHDFLSSFEYVSFIFKTKDEGLILMFAG